MLMVQYQINLYLKAHNTFWDWNIELFCSQLENYIKSDCESLNSFFTLNSFLNLETFFSWTQSFAVFMSSYWRPVLGNFCIDWIGFPWELLNINFRASLLWKYCYFFLLYLLFFIPQSFPVNSNKTIRLFFQLQLAFKISNWLLIESKQTELSSYLRFKPTKIFFS